VRATDFDVATAQHESFLCHHFALANPGDDDTATSLPVLLRRVADEIEAREIQPMQILDLTVSEEMTASGPWWSATVYWAPGE
jgi:hypothetical protein